MNDQFEFWVTREDANKKYWSGYWTGLGTLFGIIIFGGLAVLIFYP